jgi:hypothetical protein
MKYNKSVISELLVSKSYAYFESGDFNINIVGIRNSSTGKRVTNAFDDLMTLSYKENGVWKYHEWACTTDNGAGTARLVEGQYRGAYIIRKHQGKYDAVCQDRPVKVYRDYVADGVYDESKIQEGVFGINIHKAGADSIQVNDWSHGCQVFKREKDFNEFMAICRKAEAIHGNRFTYTLIPSFGLDALTSRVAL